MQRVKHTTGRILPLPPGGWLVVALLMLWVQLAAALHHHDGAGDAPGHRVGSCDLCVAQAAPAAPPPATVAAPLAAALLVTSVLPVPRAPIVDAHRVPHSPRDPPVPRHG